MRYPKVRRGALLSDQDSLFYMTEPGAGSEVEVSESDLKIFDSGPEEIGICIFDSDSTPTPKHLTPAPVSAPV